MEENLIGYLLDALDERTREQVETYLQQHPKEQERLTLLRQALTLLEADATAPTPPPQLATRTLGRIAEHLCEPSSPSSPATGLPQAPPVLSSARLLGLTHWRRADVVVAACLLALVAGIGLSVLGRLHRPGAAVWILDCQNNLRLFFTALEQYRDVNRRFPDITQEEPRSVAGMVVPLLIEAGTLPANASIRCPANGAPMSCPLTLKALRGMSDAEFLGLAPCLSLCYAYSLGYRDEEGRWHGPGANPQISLSQLPIMADRPPTEGVVGNSINHGGAGQNVLFSDGHLMFLPQRTLGNGDDIFLNRQKKVAAGVDAEDIVLGYSASRP